jgi:septal ring factor EnvC (AmiA/AmiB activator)
MSEGTTSGDLRVLAHRVDSLQAEIADLKADNALLADGLRQAVADVQRAKHDIERLDERQREHRADHKELVKRVGITAVATTAAANDVGKWEHAGAVLLKVAPWLVAGLALIQGLTG